jgi:lantibiotic modifying enzyme
VARAACVPIRHVLDSRQTDTLLEHELIGAGNGLGGIVYALVLLSRILREQAFLETSERVAALLTTARIASDRRLDVEGGAAGAALGLAALYEETGEEWVRERAVACCEHLLLTKTPANDGWGWPGHEGIPLAGFAHGAAGIAWALARLFLITGQERFREAVGMAHRFERSLFCSSENNWPLLVRDPSSGEVRRIPMLAWCHGAPGIALARACSLAACDDDDTRTELEKALESTRRLGLGRLDHLCCGSFGPVDVLLTVGRILERPDLIAAARARAARVLKRAIANEGFSLSLSRSARDSFRPGFFQGTSGIGYELLRLERPSDLPSVLSFARNV